MGYTGGKDESAFALRSTTETGTPAPTGRQYATEMPGFPVVNPELYRIEAEHARGGIGRVSRAVDQRLRRPVAVKELINNTDEARRRFMREAELTARLQHPSIVPIHDVGELQDGDFFRRVRIQVDGTYWEVGEFWLEPTFDNVQRGVVGLNEMYAGIKDVPVLGTIRVGHTRIPHGLEGDMTASSSLSSLSGRGSAAGLPGVPGLTASFCASASAVLKSLSKIAFATLIASSFNVLSPSESP